MAKSKEYNREFQLQTSRLVVEQGSTLTEASERLSTVHVEDSGMD